MPGRAFLIGRIPACVTSLYVRGYRNGRRGTIRADMATSITARDLWMPAPSITQLISQVPAE